MFKKIDRKTLRSKIKLRIRKKIFGAPERPRLSVYRSSQHIYAQIIDDVQGATLVAASTLDPDLRGKYPNGSNAEAAKMVGELVARRALDRGIKEVVFDRGGNIYHGRIAALADGARAAGLEF
ncbi:MAG: 50S ribosomal protein L18 [Bacillota bacterium]